MNIRIPPDLTLASFNAILEELNRLNAVETLNIDLSSLKRTEPGGLLPLTSKLRGHVSAGGQIVIEAYPEALTCRDLDGMGFFHILGIKCPHEHDAGHPNGNDFIEITEIGLHAIKEPTRDRLRALVAAHVSLEEKIGQSFFVACGELIENTKHAYNEAIDIQASKWPQALVQCQYNEPERLLHVCVVDCGIGLRRSIGAKDPDLYGDDKSAIEAALILGMRGGLGPLHGKGLGLAALSRFMRKNGGHFSIRTGECLAVISPNKKYQKVEPWKGTVVTLEINRDREVDIGAIIEQMEKGQPE